MSGLREQKKNEVRNKIISISKELFLQNGYDNTSTKEIAKRASIGAGTLFNYFPTKADILLEIIFNKIDKKDIQSDIDIQNVTSAKDVIYDYIMSTVSSILKIPNSLLKDFGIAFLSLSKRRKLIEKAINVDKFAIIKLEHVIDTLKTAELIHASKDTKQLAKLIYSELFFDMILYVFDNDFSKKEFEGNISSSIDFLLQ